LSGKWILADEAEDEGFVGNKAEIMERSSHGKDENNSGSDEEEDRGSEGKIELQQKNNSRNKAENCVTLAKETGINSCKEHVEVAKIAESQCNKSNNDGAHGDPGETGDIVSRFSSGKITTPTRKRGARVYPDEVGTKPRMDKRQGGVTLTLADEHTSHHHSITSFMHEFSPN
jgi:hypothetical protein